MDYAIIGNHTIRLDLSRAELQSLLDADGRHDLRAILQQLAREYDAKQHHAARRP